MRHTLIRFLLKKISWLMNVTFKQYFDHLCLLNFSTDLIKINAYVKTILFVKVYLTI